MYRHSIRSSAIKILLTTLLVSSAVVHGQQSVDTDRDRYNTDRDRYNTNQNDRFKTNQNQNDPRFPNTNQNDPFNRFPNSNQNFNNPNRNRDFTSSTPSSYQPGRDVFGNTIDNANGFGIGGTTRPRVYDQPLISTTFNNPFGPRYEAGQLIQEATYFIVASRMVRPGQVYRCSVHILEAIHPMTVRASISRDGVEMSSDFKEVKENILEELLMRVPTTSVPGEYSLRVEGLYNSIMGGVAFINETRLTFSQRSMTIFVQTDKPVYMQGEYVKFRTIPITTELKGFDNTVDVYMIDPKGHTVRRWLSRQSNLGAVSLEYKLADQPIYGDWAIRVIAQGQVEEAKFSVEEYYQTRFEVNVTMPAFFFNTDPYVYGTIMANFTNGAPVNGNLTLKAIIRPIGLMNHKAINQKFRVWHYGPRNQHERHIDPNDPNYNNYEGGYNTYNNRYDDPTLDIDRRDQRFQTGTYSDQYFTEKVFTFNEEWPFWVYKPEYNHDTFYDKFNPTYQNQLPFLRYFNGTYHFRYPMYEIQSLVNSLTGMEVLFTATVGERFYDEVAEGYAMVRIYNSSIRARFLGGSPQVFKPAMPFKVYVAVEYYDGSPLDPEFLYNSRMEIEGNVQSNQGSRVIPQQLVRMSEKTGIWEFKIDLRNDLNLNDREGSTFVNEAKQLHLTATFVDIRGERATTNLLMLAHDSPKNKQIKVSTSTTNARVGEYIIFHIQGNFFLEEFNYMIMSKGIVLLSGQEPMGSGVRTMAVTLSAEMAPVATVVVWHIGHQGLIVADSLTFPVNGISRNNFTVYINNRKARTGERVEVAIYGEAGAYVGLSGIDNAFYTMQAGHDLTYAKVISKMSSFDEQTNGTFKQVWHSHEGIPDELVYFPSSTFGIDANRTFEYAGLVVFTDTVVPRRSDMCNLTLGYAECLTGRCYLVTKRCDGFIDCDDGTDELGCDDLHNNQTSIIEFRKYRINRIKRHYENVWLWRDINIGPHGRFIFSIDVPQRPAHWMVTAFSISPTLGFGMIPKAIEYIGVQPFFINVEMPNHCGQGEQVGVRVTVFNYMTTAIEATVVLHGSPDYQFVQVGDDGLVNSYNPKTSFGEHQFFIYMDAQSSSTVYVPIVPTRLGDIKVTVHAATLLGKHQITRKLNVFADGLPQYRHQSILLDLSNRAYIFQYMHVNVTETPIIPYEIDRYYVFGSNKAELSVVGDVVGPIFPTMPVNATSMLHLPMDSAEQNMFSFAANLFTIMYMRLINQRNRTIENEAFHHLNIGYQRQLSFMMPDGSFSLFRSDFNHSDSSVWLTAYCARIFQEASFYEWENFIYIDPFILKKSVYWLLRHQMPEGSFYETTWSPDRKMNMTTHPLLRAKNITLTAHVLITLTQMKDLPGGLGARVVNAQQRAIQWIERSLPILKEHGDPYDVAIVAYALMLSNAATAEHAFGILVKHSRTVGDLMYWGNEDVPLPPSKLENQKWFSLPRLPYTYDSLNIETTAYALLTYVARRELFVDPIIRWLNAQRLTDAGWASTQDTSVALRALIEYTVRSRIRDVSHLSITVEATSLPGAVNTLDIGTKNIAQRQSLEIPNAWGTVKVQGKGAGYAILQMHVQYNVDNVDYQTKPPVPAFDLQTIPRFHGRNQSHITYVSCQRWTNTIESERSGMAVLDIAIPTGYIIQQQRLDQYVLSRVVHRLQRATFLERKVVFYFDYLDNEQTCINFTIERWYPVANMTRYLPIRVYDYYAPERFNETILDALPTYLLNICEVCGSSQCPYCYIYNAAGRAPVSFMLIIATTVLFMLRINFRVSR